MSDNFRFSEHFASGHSDVRADVDAVEASVATDARPSTACVRGDARVSLEESANFDADVGAQNRQVAGAFDRP